MSRPKLDPAQVRRSTLGVRVTDADRARIEERAAAMGMTPADWLRQAGLSRRLPSPPVPAVNREQYAELGRLAGNLNQLARAANEGRAVVDAALLEQVAAECSRLRLALMGLGDES